LVGAKTVKGPGPESVSTSRAAWTALTRVEKSGLAAATATRVMAWAWCVDCARGRSWALAGRAEATRPQKARAQADEMARRRSIDLLLKDRLDDRAVQGSYCAGGWPDAAEKIKKYP